MSTDQREQAHPGGSVLRGVGWLVAPAQWLRRSPRDGAEASPGGKDKDYVARAELTLASDNAQPLRQLPLAPDPLTGFARALGAVRGDLGETASVVVDVLPLSPKEQAHHRREFTQQAAGEDTAPSRRQQLVDQVRLGAGHPAPARRENRAGSQSRLHGQLQRRELQALSTRADPEATVFAIQVLIRAASPIRGRPQAHVQALLASWEAWAGRNHLKVHGTHLGVAFLGADAPWRRRDFDRRFFSARFDPAEDNLVTGGELAGWLKPPSKHCRVSNVVRSGGVVPPPPARLPTWQPDRSDLLPLGQVSGADGERMVGARLSESVFSYMAGRSRFGKTEAMINQFVHLARAGHGCFFLDPHEDGLQRIKPYLTDLADRVVEINLAPRGLDHRQAGWNLLSMEGLGGQDLEMRMSAVVDSFASALRWGEVNNRALTLTSMAAKSLLELALRLPADLAPTIFQMTTLLSDEQWRETVVPWLSKDSQTFWASRFPRLSADAITPVTNLLDRLASSHAVKGLLGASRSSYDIRRCMDQGKVVLACPAGTGDKDRLVANFLVYDLLQAALSRKDTPPQARRPFYVFLDEVQTYDGASRGNLAALLEQSGKYGVRAFLANQNPERLTPATYDAVTTNRSHLATTAVNARAAQLLAKEYGGDVEPRTIAGLARYSYVTSVTLDGDVTPPFRVRGVPVDELWADAYHPDGLTSLDQAVDANTGRRPIRDTAAELDTLDERIRDHLQRSHQAGTASPANQQPAAPTRGSGRTENAPVCDRGQVEMTDKDAVENGEPAAQKGPTPQGGTR